MKTSIAIVAALLAIAGNVPYLRDIIKKKVKPHPYTWLVWTIVSCIVFFGQVARGAGIGALSTAASEIFTVIIFLLSLKYGFKNIRRIDTYCLIIALVGIIPWLLTKDPTISVVIAVSIDLFAFSSTVKSKLFCRLLFLRVLVFVGGGAGARGAGPGASWPLRRPLPGPRLLRLVPPPCAGRFSPSTPDWFPSAAPKPAASTTAHEETPGSRASFASTPGSAAPAYSSCASAFDAPPAARRHPGSVHHIRPAAGPPWEPFSPTPRWPLRAPLWPPRALPTRSPPSSAAALADAAAGRTAPARCARSAPGSAATPRPENASRWPSPCRHDRRSPRNSHRAARAASTPRRPHPNWPPTPTRQSNSQAPRDSQGR